MKHIDPRSTPLLGCLREALRLINSYKVEFTQSATLWITSCDCKDSLIESITVREQFPQPLKEGSITLSVRLTTGEYFYDYPVIEEDDELYSEASLIVSKFFNRDY